MKLIRTVLLSVLILILLVALFQNQQALGTTLEFSFLKWTFSLILGFWILFTFVAVAALFVLVGAWRGLWMRREIRKRDQEIVRLTLELDEEKKRARQARHVTGDAPLQ